MKLASCLGLYGIVVGDNTYQTHRIMSILSSQANLQQNKPALTQLHWSNLTKSDFLLAVFTLL